MNKKLLLISLLILGLVIFFAYGGLPKTFFQQDEWLTFGNTIYFTITKASFLEIIFPVSGLSHFIPLSRLLPIITYKLIGINFASHALLTIVLQILNSLLASCLTWLLTKNKPIALINGLLFAVNYPSSQSVIWLAASTGIQLTSLFLFLSLIFFQKRRLWLSAFALLVSLGFKENSIFLFGLMPIIFLFTSSRKNFSELKKLTPLWVIGFVYLLMRLVIMFFAPIPHGAPEVINQPTNILVYPFRLLTLPFKVISQTFIPQEQIIKMAAIIMKLGYPFLSINGSPNPYIVESVASDIISYWLTGMILALFSITVFLLKKQRPKEIPAVLFFSLLFIVFGSWPLALIPGRAGFASLVEGRHLYLLTFGTGLLLVGTILELMKNVFKLNPKLITALLLIIFVPYILFNMIKIRSSIRQQIEIGNIRKSILSRILSDYPQLSEETIFYIESDKVYYGLPPEEKIPPFQSGLGQTLMVWYFVHGQQLPACFFKIQGDFLYGITEEGYRECEGRGFGYFRKYDNLVETLKINHLNRSEVIAYQFKSGSNSLIDISDNFREKLGIDLKQTK